MSNLFGVVNSRNLSLSESKLLFLLLKKVNTGGFQDKLELTIDDLESIGFDYKKSSEVLTNLSERTIRQRTESGIMSFALIPSLQLDQEEQVIKVVLNEDIIRSYRRNEGYFKETMLLKGISLKMFNFLHDSRETEMYVELPVLRAALLVGNKYEQYGHFKSKVLNPSIEDINQNTSFQVSYEEITEGRKVTSLRFIKQ